MPSSKDHRWVWPMLALSGALTAQGCAGGVSSNATAGFDGHVAQGDYSGAAAYAVGAGQIAQDGSSNNLLWSLDAGAAMVYAGDKGHAIPVLDHAENMMQRRDLGTVSQNSQYRAKTYDGVMVNAYKAIAAMEVGNRDIARTELLRSDERQSRAEQDFQAEAAASGASPGATNFDLQGAMRSAESNPSYRQAVQDMANYGGYKPFINPFATYLTALYFLNTPDGDPERARNDFQRVRGIVGPSPLLDRDYDLAAQRTKFSPKTWVIFENGQGSTLTQYSITFPVPIVGKRTGISSGTVALPRLQENAPAAHALLVGDSGQMTTVVGNFDYVMRSEFQRRYPSILTAAILEVAAKIALQNAAAQEKSGVALLVSQVVSNISTADVRSWSVLPKEFQVARIETPSSGKVRIRSDNGVDLGSATVPTDVSSIVYVKELRPGSPPAIQVLRF